MPHYYLFNNIHKFKPGMYGKKGVLGGFFLQNLSLYTYKIKPNKIMSHILIYTIPFLIQADEILIHRI